MCLFTYCVFCLIVIVLFLAGWLELQVALGSFQKGSGQTGSSQKCRDSQ